MKMSKIWWPVILLIPIVVWASFEAAYWNRIYPGVRVSNLSLGNMSTPQAQSALLNLQEPDELTFTWGTSVWSVPSENIGLVYIAGDTAQSALDVGRVGSTLDRLQAKLNAWFLGHEIAPKYIWDETLLDQEIDLIAAQIDIPVQNPQITVENNVVTVSSGENGQKVDRTKLKEFIHLALSNFASEVQLPITRLEPKLTSDRVGFIQTQAQLLIGQKMTVSQAEKSWEITGEQIISWIDPTAVTAKGLAWENEDVAVWVEQLAESINRPAQNAHFIFNGGRVEEFKPAENGLGVNQQELVAAILSHAQTLPAMAPPVIEVPVMITKPNISTEDVNNLGIRELVGRGESNYAGSIVNRVFNLTKAANNFNGVLIAPGEVFSFNKYVGDISTAGGYRQAYIIKDGRTILGDGGGVCQVSTTMFRAALDTGLPIEERHAHAYRVSYYENDSQPGFDATIFTPSVDLKFTNDTPGHILIQTKIDEVKKILSFEFYGTSDGRQVSISKARLWDAVPPPPDLYQDDPTLPTGTVKQVDWAASGLKTSFDYKVERDGEVLQERTFYSNFRPWQAVYLRGTGTN